MLRDPVAQQDQPATRVHKAYKALRATWEMLAQLDLRVQRASLALSDRKVLAD